MIISGKDGFTNRFFRYLSTVKWICEPVTLKNVWHQVLRCSPFSSETAKCKIAWGRTKAQKSVFKQGLLIFDKER